MSNIDEQLRYPIGKFTPQPTYTAEEVSANIDRIDAFPAKVIAVAKSFSPEQFHREYRAGGWTALQVIHHLADSHMNAYIRTKWMLTESTPVIKAYNEKAWAETPETKLDASLSLQLLTALHTKWTALLRNLPASERGREFTHPETGKNVPLDRLVALYAWHGEHHLGHLKIVASL